MSGLCLIFAGFQTSIEANMKDKKQKNNFLFLFSRRQSLELKPRKHNFTLQQQSCSNGQNWMIKIDLCKLLLNLCLIRCDCNFFQRFLVNIKNKVQFQHMKAHCINIKTQQTQHFKLSEREWINIIQLSMKHLQICIDSWWSWQSV